MINELVSVFDDKGVAIPNPRNATNVIASISLVVDVRQQKHQLRKDVRMSYKLCYNETNIHSFYLLWEIQSGIILFGKGQKAGIARNLIWLKEEKARSDP